MKKIFLSLVLSGGILFAFMTTGCSSKNASDTDTTSATETTAVLAETETDAVQIETETDAVSTEEILPTIGEENTSIEKIRLKNNTGNNIKAFQVKKAEEKEYQSNLLADDDVFAADEARYLYYEIEDAVSTEDNTEDENLLTQEYDVQITFVDDTIVVLHAFPFDDIQDGEILLEDGIAYLKYISKKSQDTIETKETEISIKEQEKAATTEAPKPQPKPQTTEQNWGGDGCLDDALFY